MLFVCARPLKKGVPSFRESLILMDTSLDMKRVPHDAISLDDVADAAARDTNTSLLRNVQQRVCLPGFFEGDRMLFFSCWESVLDRST